LAEDEAQIFELKRCIACNGHADEKELGFPICTEHHHQFHDRVKELRLRGGEITVIVELFIIQGMRKRCGLPPIGPFDYFYPV
jgi:hypothetical protein